MCVFDQVFVNTISFKQVMREGKPTFAYYQNKGKVEWPSMVYNILSGLLCSKNSSGKISSLVL